AGITAWPAPAAAVASVPMRRAALLEQRGAAGQHHPLPVPGGVTGDERGGAGHEDRAAPRRRGRGLRRPERPPRARGRPPQVADGMPPMFAGGLRSAGGVVFLRSAEFDSDPHPAPARQWVVMLRGAIEIEVSDGTRRRFEPGDLLLVTDTTGTGHLTSAAGDPPLEALFVPEMSHRAPG